MAFAIDTDEMPAAEFAMQSAPPAMDGTHVRGLKVFRTGKFKNSRGIQKEWTAAELDRMVGNFNTLRETGAFVDVPVRIDHSSSINSVVGYIEGIRREGDFLVADLEFTEPEAAAKYERRTLRARSLEVAGFETNDEQVHWPVVQGLAWVDIGAVEGLHRKFGDPEKNIAPDESEGQTGATDDNGETSTMPEQPHTFNMKGVATTDYAAVQAYITELEKRPERLPEPPEPHTFRVYGEETQDFAKVQAHVDSLETVITEMDMGARDEFVKELAKEGKILASKLDEVNAYAKSLNRAAFDAWAKNWEYVPTSALFENHGGTGEPGAPATGGEMKQVEVDQAIVDAYRRAGRDDEWISKTDAGKRLAAAAR